MLVSNPIELIQYFFSRPRMPGIECPASLSGPLGMAAKRDILLMYADDLVLPSAPEHARYQMPGFPGRPSWYGCKEGDLLHV